MKLGFMRIVKSPISKKTLTGLIIGAIALASAMIWIILERRIDLSFEMLEL